MPEENTDRVHLAIRKYADLINLASKPHFAVPNLEPILDIYDMHESYRDTVTQVLLPDIDRHIENVRNVMERDTHFHEGHSDYGRVRQTYQGIIERLERLRNSS